MTKQTFIRILITMLCTTLLALLYVNCVCAMGLPSYKYEPCEIAIDTSPWTEEQLEAIRQITAEQEPVEYKPVVDYSAMVNEEDVKILGNVLYGEARGLSDTEQSAVIWCILNRVDAGYGSIKEVVTAKHQFCGYNANRTYKTDAAKDLLKHCEELSRDVLIRYYQEQDGVEEVGRTLPSDYLYFLGDGKHNNFTQKWKGTNIWDWSLESPYES